MEVSSSEQLIDTLIDSSRPFSNKGDHSFIGGVFKKLKEVL